MTPSCTSGVAVFGPGGSASDHASWRFATLFLSMSSSGEKPSPSCVRRQLNQSFGDGLASISSVTMVTAFSALGPSGQRGSSTPVVSGPPGLCARRRCCSVSSGAGGRGACACSCADTGADGAAAAAATAAAVATNANLPIRRANDAVRRVDAAVRRADADADAAVRHAVLFCRPIRFFITPLSFVRSAGSAPATRPWTLGAV